RGLSVTIVEKLEQLMSPLDADMASFVHAKFRKQGVRLALGSAVTGYERVQDGILTHLDVGEPLCSDMVVLAIGVSPDSTLAREAGLELGVRGSIAVDEHMRTSASDVYAVGDAVQIRHLVTGREAMISLAGPANQQARAAAAHVRRVARGCRGAHGRSTRKP